MHNDIYFDTSNRPQSLEFPEFIFIVALLFSESYQNRIPLVLPMYHIYGFSIGILASLSKGSKIITLPKFTSDSFIDVLRKHDITQIFAAPPIGKCSHYSII